MRLDGLTARLGGGLVRFGGRIGLDGYKPGEFDVTATGDDMRLRYPEGFRSLVDADLSLRGPFESPVLWRHGHREKRGLDTGGSRPRSTCSSSSATRRRSARRRRRPSFPLRFDVRLLAPSTLRVDNNVARIASSADLTLRGTYDRPLLFGRAEIERGEVTFEGRRYVVTRGTIDFSNPTRIEPFFDVEAQTRVRVPGQTYSVTLTLAGTFIAAAVGASIPIRRCRPWTCSRCCSATRRRPTPSWPQLERPDADRSSSCYRRARRSCSSARSPPRSAGSSSRRSASTRSRSRRRSSIPTQQSSRLEPGARLTIGKRISARVYLTFSQTLSLPSTTRDQVILLEFDESDRCRGCCRRTRTAPTPSRSV